MIEGKNSTYTCKIIIVTPAHLQVMLIEVSSLLVKSFRREMSNHSHCHAEGSCVIGVLGSRGHPRTR